jgi:hypothetical protein
VLGVKGLATSSKTAHKGSLGKAFKESLGKNLGDITTLRATTSTGDQRQYKAVGGDVTLAEGVKAGGSLAAGSAGYELAGEVSFDPKKGLAVSGNAGASVKLVSGAARIDAGLFEFALMGEEMRARFHAGLSAAVVAEAQGSLEVNLKRSDGGVGLSFKSPKAGAEVSGFAGAKAGVEAGAELEWNKRVERGKAAEAWLRSIAGTLPEGLLAAVLDEVAPHLFGPPGWTALAGIVARAEGSAGVGGALGLGVSFPGGRLRVTGNAQGTVGLGVGGKVDVDIGVVDGVRFFALMSVLGARALVDDFGVPPEVFAERLREWSAQIGRLVFEYGTGVRGGLDYAIPDAVAIAAARALGYEPAKEDRTAAQSLPAPGRPPA